MLAQKSFKTIQNKLATAGLTSKSDSASKMTLFLSGNNSVAPTATIFVTKKVFLNDWVNHWSIFSALTPKTKVAPKPTNPGRENSRPEKIWPGNFPARKCLAGKFLGQKKPGREKSGE